MNWNCECGCPVFIQSGPVQLAFNAYLTGIYRVDCPQCKLQRWWDMHQRKFVTYSEVIRDAQKTTKEYKEIMK